MIELLKDCKIITEFGGPSPLFEPYYKIFPDIDGYNLFEDNYWQKEFKETYKGTGKQFNQDIVNIQTETKYDLILCSHVIEHLANPILALRRWSKILNRGGFVFSVIPEKSLMFDCHRPLTNISHLAMDYFNRVEENDETHIKEAVELFVNNGGYDYENYVKSSKDNFKYRAIHHHCFDKKLVVDMFNVAGYELINQEQIGMHIYTLSQYAKD